MKLRNIKRIFASEPELTPAEIEILGEDANRFPVPDSPPGLESQRSGVLELRRTTAAIAVSVIALVAGAGGYFGGLASQPEEPGMFDQARLMFLQNEEDDWNARDTCFAKFEAKVAKRTGKDLWAGDYLNAPELAACYKEQELEVANYKLDASKAKDATK